MKKCHGCATNRNVWKILWRTKRCMHRVCYICALRAHCPLCTGREPSDNEPSVSEPQLPQQMPHNDLPQETQETTLADEIEIDLLLRNEDVIKISVDLFRVDDVVFVGEGGYANVFKANAQGCGEFGVKYYKKRKVEREELRELKLLLQIQHPNIVRFCGILVEDNEIRGYLMDFMPDKTVFEALHRQTHLAVTTDMRYSWICQAAEGLDYLRECSIVHRDVTPKNMLLKHEGASLCLCDMGKSRKINIHDVLTGGLIGTPIYTAPEVLTAPNLVYNAYDCQCDVYSLAICSWQIVTNRKPYDNWPAELSPQEFENFLHGICVNGVRPELLHIEDEVIRPFIQIAWQARPEIRPTMKEISEFFAGQRLRIPNNQPPLRMMNPFERY